jgi:hypothetical protein
MTSSLGSSQHCGKGLRSEGGACGGLDTRARARYSTFAASRAKSRWTTSLLLFADACARRSSEASTAKVFRCPMFEARDYVVPNVTSPLARQLVRERDASKGSTIPTITLWPLDFTCREPE